MTQIIKVNQIKVGDVILPPERELRLWMRRHAAEKGMSESALNLTVTEVSLGSLGKGGRWINIRTEHNQEWGNKYPFGFRARPETNWTKIEA